jgi:hypothetical protein
VARCRRAQAPRSLGAGIRTDRHATQQDRSRRCTQNLFNAYVALRDHPDVAGKLAYNEFAGCTWARGPLPWDDRPDRPWTEFDDLKATEWLQSPEVRIMVGAFPFLLIERPAQGWKRPGRSSLASASTK